MGLTLAKRLAKAGQQVTILEGASEIGGLASAWNLGDIIWDRHYHVTLLSDQFTRGMLADLGLENEMQWIETKTGFLSQGQLYSMSNSWEFLKFSPLNLWEKLRLGLTIFVASRIRNPKKLERIFVSDWLTRWSGRGTFRKIWQPLLQAKLGPAYKKVTAAFIWATIARMYRARQTGLKKEMFGYLPGGYARTLDAYADELSRLGVNIVCSSKVERVSTQTDDTVCLNLCDGTSTHYDKVVLTISSSTAAKLCPEMQPLEHKQHADIEYLGIICASIVLTKPISPYYVTNIIDDGIPFTAVIEMTALVDPAEFGGRHLVYLPRYANTDDPTWQQSDEQLRDQFLKSLCDIYPHLSTDDVVAFRISRVQQVMALPTLNYSEKIPPFKTTLKNVYVVNSSHIVKGTLNVNEVIDIAEAAFRDAILPTLSCNDQTAMMAGHV